MEQRPKDYVRGDHQAIIDSVIFDKVKEALFWRARLVQDEHGKHSIVEIDAVTNTC